MIDSSMNALARSVATPCIALSILSGCSIYDHRSGGPDTEANVVAVARLTSSSGSRVSGSVNFVKEKKGLRVDAMITGLRTGRHGFHIHEKGDCSAEDASSAGGHFNTTSMPHAGPEADQHHLGDFGNLEADELGKAVYSKIFTDLSVDGEWSIIGRAVVIHEGADDMQTHPAGNSGGRLGCGVIERK